MKDLINLIADPIYSFTITIIGFFFFMKYYYVVGTKKFMWITAIAGTAIFGWMCTDPNFFAIVTWPDNVPIVILLTSI